MKLLSSILFSAVLIIGIGFIAPQAHAQVASGCTSTNGFSTATGAPCNGATTIPAGCTSTAGFNNTTGQPCNGNTAAANGYDGTTVGANGFINGCTSTAGYSATTGYACNTAINGVIYAGPGNSVVVGLPGTVTTSTITNPGLPTTGSTDAAATIVILAAVAAVAIGAMWYAGRYHVA